jgi:erythromycin esterase-like protein
MESVVAYLDSVDPEAARLARQRYSCFDHVDAEGARYRRAVAWRGKLPGEREVVAELIDLRRRALELLSRDGWLAEDEYFFAEQNARLVRDAEEY